MQRFNARQITNLKITVISRTRKNAKHCLGMARRSTIRRWCIYQILEYVKIAFCVSDPRTQDWPLLDIRLAAAMTVSYLLIVPIGIHFMHKRPPFQIKFFTTIHNTILFLLSLYMCIESIKQVKHIILKTH